MPPEISRLAANHRATRCSLRAWRSSRGHRAFVVRYFTSTMTSTARSRASKSISPRGVRRLRDSILQPRNRNRHSTYFSAQRPETDVERKKPPGFATRDSGGHPFVDSCGERQQHFRLAGRNLLALGSTLPLVLVLAANSYFFTDLGRLAHAISEIIQFRPADSAETFHFDFLNPW